MSKLWYMYIGLFRLLCAQMLSMWCRFLWVVFCSLWRGRTWTCFAVWTKLEKGWLLRPYFYVSWSSQEAKNFRDQKLPLWTHEKETKISDTLVIAYLRKGSWWYWYGRMYRGDTKRIWYAHDAALMDVYQIANSITLFGSHPILQCKFYFVGSRS